jgi:lysine 2,3-aminomutase
LKWEYPILFRSLIEKISWQEKYQKYWENNLNRSNTDSSCKSLFNNIICSKEELEKQIKLNNSEIGYFNGSSEHPFRITNYYFSLINKVNPDDPVRKQCIPSVNEFVRKEYESNDPLCERKYSPYPGFIHRYKNRALLLLTDKCAVYCRHCFRRSFTGREKGVITKDRFEKSIKYVKEHKEIRELLLSGGDPLTLDNKVLHEIFKSINTINRNIAVRICTRIPVVLPERIDSALIETIKQLDKVWIVTQFNHYNEITSKSRRAVELLVKSGFPLLNQTVLLKGINDKKDILAKLFTELAVLNVKPLYVFQGDLASGTGHFRTNLEKGTSIMRDVYSEISGIARPFYAVDLPGCGGKKVLSVDAEYKSLNGFYRLKDNKGKVYFYPAE